MGTSLWLVPPSSSSEAAALQGVITSLSKEHTSPLFDPHVTLANIPASISLAEIVSCLSSEETLEIAFETIRTGPTFFQSVYIVIQTSSALSRLHEHVHKTLGVQPKTPEFAHLSLYYGDEGKEGIPNSQWVDEAIVRRLWADGVLRAVEPRGIKIQDVHKFLVEEIWVVNCNGGPEDWVVAEKIPLKSRERL